jgi:mRNA-degrading endonuclease RelE of RelBE toxin-antitoxin system
MVYRIEICDLAESELTFIRAFDRRRIVDEMRGQLTHQPAVTARNRKRLDAAVPHFEHTPPVWELRVGEYRVFYDVDEANLVVYVRAVRRKQQGETTEDVIDERNHS